MSVAWTSVFLDFPASSYDAGVAFWSGVTGWPVSSARGPVEEFATLVPPVGDPVLKVQRLEDPSGPGRVHVDLNVGEWELCRTSPGGFGFCLVAFGPADPVGFVRPPAADWGTHTSAVDQICLDIPSATFDEECAFWAHLVGEGRSGWTWADTGDPDYRRLQPPPGLPWRILLQRRLEGGGPVAAHLDLATTSRLLETARHERLGARVVQVFDEWAVLLDPTGQQYCITDRVPAPVP